MNKVKRKNIEEFVNFTKYGTEYRLIGKKDNFYLFKTGYEVAHYEVWKGVKTKWEDEVYYRAPSSEEWGVYGWSIYGSLRELQVISRDNPEFDIDFFMNLIKK